MRVRDVRDAGPHLGDAARSGGAARGRRRRSCARLSIAWTTTTACRSFYEIRPRLPAALRATRADAREDRRGSLVPLHDFSLEGGARKGLRTSVHRLEREGLQFRMLCRTRGGSRMRGAAAGLRRVAERKAVAEKGFSLGFFDEAYLRRCPVAVLERDGRIEAFANLWRAGRRRAVRRSRAIPRRRAAERRWRACSCT